MAVFKSSRYYPVRIPDLAPVAYRPYGMYTTPSFLQLVLLQEIGQLSMEEAPFVNFSVAIGYDRNTIDHHTTEGEQEIGTTAKR